PMPTPLLPVMATAGAIEVTLMWLVPSTLTSWPAGTTARSWMAARGSLLALTDTTAPSMAVLGRKSPEKLLVLTLAVTWAFTFTSRPAETSARSSMMALAKLWRMMKSKKPPKAVLGVDAALVAQPSTDGLPA